VGINELKIQMAESSLRLRPSQRATVDLITALEEFLNASCMGKLPQTLSYNGNPTDPTCIARMRRVLEINPGNPVGVCVRDGISAQTCVAAYNGQQLRGFWGSSSSEDIDPALRVGLSANDTDKLSKIEESLSSVDNKYRSATTDEEKRAYIEDASNLYEQALAISCKVSSLILEPSEKSVSGGEPTEIAQARAKLLQIPPAIRGDYQKEMMNKAEAELAKPGTSSDRKALLTRLLQVIEKPDGAPALEADQTTRVRMVLGRCYQLIDRAVKANPNNPSPVCYREGWYSPQCIQAQLKVRVQRQREELIAQGKNPNSVGTPSIISSF
jgi:hypothetical protein